MYKEYLAQSFRNVEVVEHSLLTGEKQVVAGQTYKPGDRVMDFTGTFITSEEAANPTFAHESFRYALQVGDGIFLA